MQAFISEQWATPNLTSAKLVGDSFKIKLLIKKNKQNKIHFLIFNFYFYFYEEEQQQTDVKIINYKS